MEHAHVKLEEEEKVQALRVGSGLLHLAAEHPLLLFTRRQLLD